MSSRESFRKVGKSGSHATRPMDRFFKCRRWRLLCAQQPQRHEIAGTVHIEVNGWGGKHVGTVLSVEVRQVEIASGGRVCFGSFLAAHLVVRS